MNKLSYTQEYYLCAMNDKGKTPAFKSTDVSACMVASAILELKENGYIEANEKNKFSAAKPWDDALPYLKPVYDSVAAAKKPQNIESLAEPFLFGQKNMDSLLRAIGNSLAVLGCTAELPEQGLMKNKTRYVPKPECTKDVIEKVRTEFLGGGTVSDATVCLSALLDKSGLVRDYFSKYEADELKARLKEIRKSETYKTAKVILDYVNTIITVITTSAISAST